MVEGENNEARARELLSELESGAKMEQLAEMYSACPSSEKGGDLGEFAPGTMVSEFDAHVFNEETKIGVPRVIKTLFGWHVVIVDERKS